jgi:hypothetical protein
VRGVSGAVLAQNLTPDVEMLLGMSFPKHIELLATAWR